MRSVAARLLWATLLPTAVAFDVWPWLTDRWASPDGFFGHGPFVAAGAVAWGAFLVRRGRVRAGGARWPALIPAVVGAAMLYLLTARGVGFLGAVGWWLAVGALTWAGLGRRGLACLAGPLLFLLFMIPWPLKLVDDLSMPLKSLALDLGLMLAPAEATRENAGAFVLLEGGGRLLVGDVCSGLRSLVTLLAMGALVAAATKTAWWGRAAVFVAATPIAVLCNAVRIAVLITVAEASGAEAVADGTTVHDGTGVAVYLLALALLWTVARFVGWSSSSSSSSSSPDSPATTVAGLGPLVTTSLVCVAFAAWGWASVDSWRERALPVLAEVIPSALRPPPGVEGPTITGRDIPLEPATERLLQPDGFLSRVFGERGTYHLCIVHGSGRRTRLHAPEICFRGSGFEVVHKRRVRPRARVEGAPSDLQELRILKDGQERLTWYWYRSAGRSTPSYLEFVLGNLLDPGAPQALIWVSIPLDAGGLEGARERLDWFLGALSRPLSSVLSGL